MVGTASTAMRESKRPGEVSTSMSRCLAVIVDTEEIDLELLDLMSEALLADEERRLVLEELEIEPAMVLLSPREEIEEPLDLNEGERAISDLALLTRFVLDSELVLLVRLMVCPFKVCLVDCPLARLAGLMPYMLLKVGYLT